jgi:hypothetical protein
MSHALLLTGVLALAPGGASAAEPAVRFSIQPAPVPLPALKYQLLPQLEELVPGNAGHEYLRCFAEQRIFFFSKESLADRAHYLAAPLADLAKEKLHPYGRGALDRADWAARMDTVNWQELDRVRPDAGEAVSPELVPLRILSEALHARLRIAVASRDFDVAIRTARTMCALARHLGEYPSFEANQLGLLIAGRALQGLGEAVQEPGCPNLYWALTDLPVPLVELRKGFQGERALSAADLRLIDDAPMTEVQIEDVVSRLSGRAALARELTGREPHNLRSALKARAADAERVRTARARLVDARAARSLIDQLSPVQVILLDEKQEYTIRRDEAMRLLALPPWQADFLARTERQGRGDGLFADLVPRVREGRSQQVLLEQRIGLLRQVEALRDYSAGHDGRLPAKLSDVGLPPPLDAVTGRPFAYSVADGTARLAGAPVGKEPRRGVVCEVSLLR